MARRGSKRERSARRRWEAILEATRELGRENRSAVARAAGVHRTTVTKAWEEGWPEHELPPIDVQLAEDRAAARAVLAGREEPPADAEEAARIQAHVDAELERARARQDAAEARAEEARGVRVFRRNAIALGTLVAGASRSMMRLLPRLEEAVAKEEMSAKQIVSVMRSTSRIAKESTEAMRVAMQLERLLLGEPGEIVEHRSGEMSVDEAADWIRRASRALDRRERFERWAEGGLKIIDGGKAS